jgi:hypothetical protein
MTTRAALIAGVLLGVGYSLSPLTVLALGIGVPVLWWTTRDMSPRERRCFLWLVGVAMAVRIAVIAALFFTAGADRPFATFFGDEELFKSRPIWIRNIGMGVPISAADFIYAYDDTGKSGYLFVLAAVQAFVGDAPYGVHVLNATIYLLGVLLLHRLARRAFGVVAALGGLALLLLLPSLFAWSISALKEPMYTFVAALEILIVLAVIRSPRVWQRLAAVAALVIAALMLESLRKGGMQVALAGSVGGLLAGAIASRPRLLAASAVIAPIALVAVLNVEPVQARVLQVVRDSVRYHAGHVLTPGHTYHLVPERYYWDWPAIFEIGPSEATQYVSRALIYYVVEPLPWVERSRAMLAYVPEQAAWLTLLALVPFGIAAGLKLDALLTATLVAHAGAIAMMVALTSGNVGTLIRHRGLVLPYLVWLAALGGGTVLTWLARQHDVREGELRHGDR